MTNREIAEKYCCHPESIDALAQELDAAERRGWIKALEWASDEPQSNIRDRLAELKAEKEKGR